VNVLARLKLIGPTVAQSHGQRDIPLTVISPHLDDAVLSCSQVLFAHPGSTVITVFAGRPPDGRWSSWDKKCFRPGQDPMSVLQKEDREALGALAASPVHLPFLDAEYGTAYAIEEIAQVLAQYVDALVPESVLVPLGILHVDHAATHKAAIRLIRARPHIRWIIYEELPYRFEYPEHREARKRELQDEGFELSELTLPHDPNKQAKLRAIRRYKSQLRALGRNRIRQALRDEQYWQVSALRETEVRSSSETAVANARKSARSSTLNWAASEEAAPGC
jgi:LmbE family N-acetylglucosaminyl deacetylase